MRVIYIVVIAVVACAGYFEPSAATAQVPTAASPPAAASAEAEAVARLRLSADYQLASWLIADLEAGRKLAEGASTTLDEGDVKQLAADLRDRRDEFLHKLAPFADLQTEREQVTEKLLVAPAAAAAATDAAEKPASADAPRQPKVTVDVAVSGTGAPVAPVPTQPSATAAVGGDGRTGTVIIAKMAGAGFDLVSLKRRLSEQRLNSDFAWLEQATPVERSRRYLLLEQSALADLQDELKVFRSHSSGKLQPVIDEIQAASRSQRDEVRKRLDR